MIQSSQFIIVLVVTQHILSYTRPLSQALQKADCDIVARNISVLSAGKRCSNCIRQWSINGKENIHFKVLPCNRCLQQRTDEPLFVPFLVSSLSDAFILADPDYYPNIREIFHILLTHANRIREWSFSALRRLKQWIRTTMVEDTERTPAVDFLLKICI
jgi:hypothetical protein